MSKRTRALMRSGGRATRLRPRSLTSEAPPDALDGAGAEAIEKRTEATLATYFDGPISVERPTRQDDEERDTGRAAITPPVPAEGVGSISPVTSSLEAEAELTDYERSLLGLGAARSRRLLPRGFVGGLVAVAGVVALAFGVRAMASGRARQMAMSEARSVAIARAPEAKTSAAPVVVTPVVSVSALPAAASASDEANELRANVAPTGGLPTLGAGPARDARQGKVEPKSFDPPVDPMKKETLRLLNQGKPKEAIELARRVIASDPTDAMTYLYLGSGLQDLGHQREAVEAYSECVRHATHGPVHDCQLLGGRK